jgi:hypothetical protein
MSRLLALLGIVALAGCTAVSQPAPAPPSPAPDTLNLTRKLQNHWDECLHHSFAIDRAKTSDKNAAAEMAFAACASEEQDQAAYTNTVIPAGFSPMPHLRAETKRHAARR